jgi:transcriptional regulator with XRE-family HTH domain
MRLERGFTQREVAERIGVQRPAVSKMERKADMSIGRFTEFVEALGGRWCIKVSFTDGREYSAGSHA